MPVTAMRSAGPRLVFSQSGSHDSHVSDHAASLGQTSLAALRTQFPGCEAVALVDIATRTVLTWDTAVKLPQERLDSLCDMALSVFDVMPPDQDSAVVTQPTGCRVFARLPDTPNEIVCGVFPDATQATDWTQAAHLFLHAHQGTN